MIVMHNNILSFEDIGKLPACEIVKLISSNDIKKLEFEELTKHVTLKVTKAILEEIKEIQVDFICASIEHDYISKYKLSKSELNRLEEADKYLTSWLESYNKSNNHEDKADENEYPFELNNDEAKSVLQRAVDAGYLDTDFMPMKSTKKADLYLLCLYAGTELKILEKWKIFEQLWNITHLQQSTKEWQIKQSRKEKIQALFDKKVIEDAAIKQ